MTVYQRGKYWHFEFSLHGVRHRGTCGKGVHSKTAALRFEAQKRAEAIARGSQPRMRRAPVLAVAAKAFLEEMEAAHLAGSISANTLRHYRNAWDAWLADTFLAKMRIDAITPGDVASVKFPGGPHTAKNGAQTVGRILNWCAERGMITAAPKIKGRRVAGRNIRITQEMETALLAHMERECADIFTIMLNCGMRPEEVMSMRWADVRWEQAEYFVPTGKTPKARRLVPMSDRMVAVLRARQQTSTSQWIFPSREHKVGHRVTIAEQWREAREAAGVDAAVVLYCARHEFATSYLEHGGDLLTLMAIMGHEDISTTNKYLHGSTKGGAEVINKRNAKQSGLKIVRSA